MNNPNLRRFAPIGLYLAGLAAIASIGLFIVQKSLTLPLQISLGLIVIGLALFILLDPQKALAALTGRQARYGSNALLMTVAFLGIIVVANYLVNGHSKQWDLTEDKTNTLAPETLQTLSALKTPVKANAYFSSQAAGQAQTAQKLLQNFKMKSGGKFDYEFIDPLSNPVRAKQDQVTRDATIVLKVGDRQEQVSYASEEDLTGALIRLANPGKRTVYFLTGHGELSTESSQDNNLSQVKSQLVAKNYTVNTLNLLSTPKIPDDAKAIVVAGPNKPLSQAEVDLIKAYQEKGGSLVYLTQPRPVTNFGDQPDPLAAYLEQAWAIKLDEDLVITIDPNSNQISAVGVSQDFANHPITNKMYSSAVVMPDARSLEAGKAPDGVTLTPLAKTSEMAWGETDYQGIQNQTANFDQGKDIPGPLTLAIAGENANTKARVLVVGDSNFADSQFYTQYGNSDFILNGIDWAAVQENLISLTPRQTTQRMIVPPQGYTMGIILLVTVFLIPGLVLLAGVTVWIQRRRRG